MNTKKIDKYNYFYHGIKASEPLTTKQIKAIFSLAVHDYLKNHIDAYNLEAIAADLYFNLSSHPNNVKEDDPKLSLALDSAADLTYFLKREDKDASHKQRVKNITKVLKEFLSQHTIRKIKKA